MRDPYTKEVCLPRIRDSYGSRTEAVQFLLKKKYLSDFVEGRGKATFVTQCSDAAYILSEMFPESGQFKLDFENINNSADSNRKVFLVGLKNALEGKSPPTDYFYHYYIRTVDKMGRAVKCKPFVEYVDEQKAIKRKKTTSLKVVYDHPSGEPEIIVLHDGGHWHRNSTDTWERSGWNSKSGHYTEVKGKKATQLVKEWRGLIEQQEESFLWHGEIKISSRESLWPYPTVLFERDDEVLAVSFPDGTLMFFVYYDGVNLERIVEIPGHKPVSFTRVDQWLQDHNHTDMHSFPADRIQAEMIKHAVDKLSYQFSLPLGERTPDEFNYRWQERLSEPAVLIEGWRWVQSAPIKRGTANIIADWNEAASASLALKSSLVEA